MPTYDHNSVNNNDLQVNWSRLDCGSMPTVTLSASAVESSHTVYVNDFPARQPPKKGGRKQKKV